MRPVLTRGRMIAWVAFFSALLVVVAAFAVALGSTHVAWNEAFAALSDPSRRADSVAYAIIFDQRLPRVLLGALVGSALGLAGAAFQAILRNPLADPYTLGVASGSAVAATIVMALGFSFSFGPFGSVQLAALLGGGLVIALIYRLGVQRHELRIEALLLGGVTVALISSSFIVVIRLFQNPDYIMTLDRWLLGGLAAVGYREVFGLLPFWLAGGFVVLALASAYNQLGLGDELAFGRGVDARAVQRNTFFAASLLTAGVVAAAGPIGFVGLIVPHAVRRIVGPDHRLLLPCAALASAAFLIACDLLARTVIAPTELPVGVVTAVLGGPMFLILLQKRV